MFTSVHGDHSCHQTCESVITSVGVAVIYNSSIQLSSHCSVCPVLYCIGVEYLFKHL